MSAVGTTISWGGRSSPSSRANASAAARPPSRAGSARTTVIAASRSASSKSSKPTSATPRRGRRALQGADRVAVVAVKSRSGGDPPEARAARPPPPRPARRRGCRGGPGLDRSDAGRSIAAGSRRGARSRCRAPRVGDERDPPVPLGEQVLDREVRAAAVVEQDRVGLEALRRAVEEDAGVAGPQLAAEVGVVREAGTISSASTRRPRARSRARARARGPPRRSR